MGWELDPDLDPPGSRTLKIRSWIRNNSFRIHTTVGNTVNKEFLTHENISTIFEHCGPVRLQLTKPGEKSMRHRPFTNQFVKVKMLHQVLKPSGRSV